MKLLFLKIFFFENLVPIIFLRIRTDNSNKHHRFMIGNQKSSLQWFFGRVSSLYKSSSKRTVDSSVRSTIVKHTCCPMFPPKFWTSVFEVFLSFEIPDQKMRDHFFLFAFSWIYVLSRFFSTSICLKIPIFAYSF